MDGVRPSRSGLVGGGCVQPAPYPQGFGNAPCLGVTATLGVRGVAIEDFWELPRAAFLPVGLHGAQIIQGGCVRGRI